MNIKVTLEWDNIQLASEIVGEHFFAGIAEGKWRQSVARLTPNPGVLEGQSIAMVPLAEASHVAVYFEVLPDTIEGSLAEDRPELTA